MILGFVIFTVGKLCVKQSICSSLFIGRILFSSLRERFVNNETVEFPTNECSLIYEHNKKKLALNSIQSIAMKL